MKKLFLVLCAALATVPLFAEAPRLVAYPLDRKAILGGNVVLSPRFYLGEGDAAVMTNIPIASVSMSLDGEVFFTAVTNPFYTKKDLTAYKNGDHILVMKVKTLDGQDFELKTALFVSNVKATFRLLLPEPVPSERQVFLSGSATALKPVGEEWNPRGGLMKMISPTNYEITIPVGLNEMVMYQYTLGGWALKSRDAKNGEYKKTVRITNDGQIITDPIAGFGKVTGSISSTGYFITFTGGVTNMRIAYTKPKPVPTVISYSINGGTWSSYSSLDTQHSYFNLSVKPGDKVDFTFDSGPKTNTFNVPVPALPFEAAFISDVHLNGTGLLKDLSTNTWPHFILNGGDLTQSGLSAGDWGSALVTFKNLNSRWYHQTVPGNHEEETPLYPLVTGLPWYYSFTYANTTFIMVNNAMGVDRGSRQLAWLEKELKAASRSTFRVVVMHIPPYSVYKHGEDLNAQEVLNPLFEKYGVQLVLSGHEHSYQATHPLIKGKPVKKGGVVYMVAGGLGGGIYDRLSDQPWVRKDMKSRNYLRLRFEKDRIVLTAIGEKGAVIDSFEITK